jgi:predicted permease
VDLLPGLMESGNIYFRFRTRESRIRTVWHSTTGALRHMCDARGGASIAMLYSIVSTLLRDLRYGVHMALRSPGFTAVAVLTLAIGIAVNTTVFSWIDMMMLRPIAGVSNAGRLAAFESVAPDGGPLPMSWPDFRDYRDRLKLVSGFAAAIPTATLNIGEGDRAGRIWGEMVSANYFSVLGVKPVAGRMFSQQECGDEPDACPVAVIGEGLWNSRFGRDPRILGTTIVLNRQRLTVIGVAPAEFRGSMPGLTFAIWLPLTMGARLNILPQHTLEDRQARTFLGIARLQRGVNIAQARAECAAAAHQLAQFDAGDAGIGATLLPIREAHFGGQRTVAGPLSILMAVCGLVFLIVCANVASLLLARSIGRRREFSVRMALGAGRARLARQLLSESLVLAVMGALAGVPLAMWMGESLAYLAPRGASLPIFLALPVNGEILAFGMFLSVAACLITGIAPALHSARAGLNEALKESGRGGGQSARSERTRGLLVVAEVALALVTLISAGLFTKSFRTASQINPGFDPRHVLVSYLDLPAAGYNGPDRTRFCERVRDQLAAQPGIVNASFADVVPLWFTGNPWETLQVEGYVPALNENMKIIRNVVSPGYLDLMRIPVVEGRGFTAHDDENAPPVVIVNQTFARRFFGGRSAIGHRVHGWGRWYTIAGIARDSKYLKPNEPATPYFYAPFRQANASPVVAVFARTAGEPEQAVAAMRGAVSAIDPGVGMFDTMPLTEFIGASLYGERMAAVMLAVLGAIALVLAATGIYSVMAYSVAQRTREIGIRMALGAKPADVLAAVLWRGMRLTLMGVAIGVAAAVAVARLAASLLVHVSATDPLVFGAGALFLAAVALAANYLPARRATRIDPNESLRCE